MSASRTGNLARISRGNTYVPFVRGVFTLGATVGAASRRKRGGENCRTLASTHPRRLRVSRELNHTSKISQILSARDCSSKFRVDFSLRKSGGRRRLEIKRSGAAKNVAWRKFSPGFSAGESRRAFRPVRRPACRRAQQRGRSAPVTSRYTDRSVCDVLRTGSYDRTIRTFERTLTRRYCVPSAVYARICIARARAADAEESSAGSLNW